MITDWIAEIKADEGCKLQAYQDTLGVWTIGYGHVPAMPHTTWTQDMADNQLAIDVRSAILGLNSALPWWRSLNDVRQGVLVQMVFQLGLKGVLAFRDTLGDAQKGAFVSASHDMLASVWARQTPARASRLAQQMRTGVRA